MKKQLNTTLHLCTQYNRTYFAAVLADLGFYLSGPAYLIAHNKVKDAKENPDDYEGNLNAMNTAKIIALVSI